MRKTKPTMTSTTSTSRTSKPITNGELNRVGVAFGAIGSIGSVSENVNVGGGDPMGGTEGAIGVPATYGIGGCP